MAPTPRFTLQGAWVRLDASLVEHWVNGETKGQGQSKSWVVLKTCQMDGYPYDVLPFLHAGLFNYHSLNWR